MNRFIIFECRDGERRCEEFESAFHDPPTSQGAEQFQINGHPVSRDQYVEIITRIRPNGLGVISNDEADFMLEKVHETP